VVVLQLEEVVKGVLYAVRWEHSEVDCFTEMLDQLDDAEYVHGLLSGKKKDLFSGFYNYKDVDEAVDAMQEELNYLTEKILECAELSSSDGKDRLRKVFKPYHNRENAYTFILSKATAKVRKPILRIYGCRVPSTGCMVLTGYAAKVTRASQGDTDTMDQHQKLKIVKKYIKATNFTGQNK